MKTLDEVIKTFDGCFLKSRKEWCIENCPYLQNDEQMCRRDVLIDALHYLKEYRKHLIQDLDELRQEKYELETNMKLHALLQEKPWEKRQ